MLACWNLATFERLWTIDDQRDVPSAARFTSTGDAIVTNLMSTSGRRIDLLLDSRTGRIVATPQRGWAVQDQSRHYQALWEDAFGQSRTGVVAVLQDGHRDPIVRLALDVTPRSHTMRFVAPSNRTHLIWGNESGHVVVAELQGIRRKLTDHKLGW